MRFRINLWNQHVITRFLMCFNAFINMHNLSYAYNPIIRTVEGMSGILGVIGNIVETQSQIFWTLTTCLHIFKALING